MLWRPRKDAQHSAVHLRSYRYTRDKYNAETDAVSLLGALQASVGLEHERSSEKKSMETPLYGMLHEVHLRDSHSSGTCIVLEPHPAVSCNTNEERLAEETARSTFFKDKKRYFSLVVSRELDRDKVNDAGQSLSIHFRPEPTIEVLRKPLQTHQLGS